MQRLKQITLVILIFAACALSCFAQAAAGGGQPAHELPPQPSSTAEYNAKAWKVFSSKEGRFSVMLPAKLKQRVQHLDTRHGRVEMHLFEAQTFAGYQVMYMSFAVPLEENAELARQLLDEGGAGGVRNVNGQLLEKKEITLEGHAGRALKVRLENGDIIRSRLYVAGNRFYAVSILTPEQDAPESVRRFHEEVAIKFLDSFKLTAAGAK